MNFIIAGLTVLILASLGLSVAAFFVASKNSDQIEDFDNRANEAAEKANRAHEIVTGYTLDEVDVHGRHHGTVEQVTEPVDWSVKAP